MGCERVPRIIEFENNGSRSRVQSAPIIVIGDITKHEQVGTLRSSRYFPDQQLQLCRITIRVENVLRGHVDTPAAEIYYFIGVKFNGPQRMGMVGQGGRWQIGDRLIFFLQRDSGVLRTVIDTWALAAVPVPTGAHPNYHPRPGETAVDSVIDILLDKGEGCDDKQFASAVSGFSKDFWDLPYTLQKLRQIADGPDVAAAQAAKNELEYLARDGRPQHLEKTIRALKEKDK